MVVFDDPLGGIVPLCTKRQATEAVAQASSIGARDETRLQLFLSFQQPPKELN